MAKAEEFNGKIICVLSYDEAGRLQNLLGSYTGGVLTDLYGSLENIRNIPFVSLKRNTFGIIHLEHEDGEG